MDRIVVALYFTPLRPSPQWTSVIGISEVDLIQCITKILHYYLRNILLNLRHTKTNQILFLFFTKRSIVDVDSCVKNSILYHCCVRFVPPSHGGKPFE
jgi:hypothetical protein